MSKHGIDPGLLSRHLSRVIVNEHGEATTPLRASQLGIKIDSVFIRNDGWTLGTPDNLKDIAYNLWADEWVICIDLNPFKIHDLFSMRKNKINEINKTRRNKNG